MSLELKHLAIAFANNQKVLYYDDERELNQICRIVELREDELTISNGEYQYDVDFNDVRLILHLLSDLTKEIKVNGDEFVPISCLLKIEFSTQDKKGKYSEIHINTDGYPCAMFKYQAGRSITIYTNFILNEKYWIIEKLLEWHFDVFGLIEQGLAIDINTL